MTEYTATTTNATNTITAAAGDDVEITITLNGDPFTNGTAATWTEGENTVVITASAEGATSTVYTVTVTAS